MKKMIILIVAAILFCGCSSSNKKTIEVTVENEVIIAALDTTKITLLSKEGVQFNGTAYANPDNWKIYIFINQKCVQDKCENVDLIALTKKADGQTYFGIKSNKKFVSLESLVLKERFIEMINDSELKEKYLETLTKMQGEFVLEKNSTINLIDQKFN